MARIYKHRDSGVYYIDFRHPETGKRIRKSLKTTRKSDAEKIKARIETGIWDAKYLDKKFSNEDLTLCEFWEEHYKQYIRANNKPSTYIDKCKKINIIFEAFGKDTKLSKITTSDIERFKNNRKDKVSASTVNRNLSLIKHMFSLAVHLEFINENPAKRVKKFPENNGRIRYLTLDEAEKLLNVCRREDKPEYIYPLVLLALNSGMRRGELLNLTWDDLDIGNNLIHVNDSKSNEPRTIPVPKEVMTIIDSLPKTCDNIFCYKGKPVREPKDTFKRCLNEANIKNFRFHDLRHTYASWLAMEGVDMLTLKNILGHKTLMMVDRYAHLSKEHIKAATEKVGKKMAHLLNK